MTAAESTLPSNRLSLLARRDGLALSGNVRWLVRTGNPRRRRSQTADDPKLTSSEVDHFHIAMPILTKPRLARTP
jgi:hypothetical protein